ncbi:DNA polymerase IV [Marinimicrobium sp. UBA4209]|mgnify:CR=1 FL=1|uniref:DNA polymerase IV n=2 Tax=unclassified Marinimicrobium TaxID=2632100 RepID=UPI00257E5747|nr:DNA polymerase IV [Marinimicrobium sp. UBA4209]
MRKIIHCDADCFFAAIEMRDDPSLRHRPIAVGGSSDRRGVISTCNYEARRYGVRSAMASAYAKRLCPDLLIVPHRMDAYREASLQMRHVFYDFSERVEPLSLDEAYLDVTDSEHCQGSATRIAEAIRERVHDALGITISAGVAPNKFLAKVASDWRKPDGLYVVPPTQVDEFVRALPVERVPGVGRATAQKLSQMGVATCGDLQAFDVFELSERFGAFGVRLHHLCHGRDERAVTVSRRRKSLSVEHTFAQDLPDLEHCLGQLPGLLQSLALRLRRVDGDYRVVKRFVKLKFEDFTSTTLERAGTDVNQAAYRALCEEAFVRGDRPVRLLGVGVRFVDLREDQAFYQLDLFS